MDVLEDLNVQSSIHSAPVSRAPVGQKAVKLANDIVEFANNATAPSGEIHDGIDPSFIRYQVSLNLDSKVSRSHKENRVLLI